MKYYIFVINLVICTSFSANANFEIKHQTYNNVQLNISKETYIITIDGPTKTYIKHRSFIPFARPFSRDDHNITDTCSSSADEFPDFLPEHVLNKGGFLLCFVIGIYCFTLLAIICNRYFLPCVETICDVLQLTPDVAAATFMSVATSCPELFTNIIGTFVTESDIGIGTIVGSSLFNVVGVASIGGLAAIVPLQLDWWPLTRDVCIYMVAISLLVTITWDGYIYWYEALVLFIVYFIYFAIMFQNTRISTFVKGKLAKNKVEDVDEESEKPDISTSNEKLCEKLDEVYKEEFQNTLFRIPEGKLWKKIFFFYSWPIQFLLRFTVPNPKVHPKLFPITFVMCILWIGVNAYVVCWMIALIGKVFNIPDAVLGLTFLAAGGGLPEAISMTIIARKGEGAFGVSNALGANTMNILLSLGMPWFFKTISMGAHSDSFITIQSGSIGYTILALIVVAIIMYIVVLLNKFKLGKRTGAILLVIYICCVVLAILSEMVFFDNSPCIP